MTAEETATVERLLTKSQEAFVMAVELYNKPTIRYRVEGFSFFICNAWELLLKAKLIKDRGIASIYYKNNPERTITLENCISKVFTNKNDPLRRNLEDIIRLRNTSTHFIVEEHEQIYQGLFQACINNYDDKAFEFHKICIDKLMPPHFLSLSMSANPISPEFIRAKYSPDVAERFLFNESQVEQEQILQDNQRYSTVIVTEMAIIKDPEKADFSVSLDKDSSKHIRVAKEFKDPKNTHPLSVKNVIEHVNKQLSKKGVKLKSEGSEKDFTTNDWKLFMNFYGFKDDRDLAYCHHIANSSSFTYSYKTVEFIVNAICDNPEGIIDELKQLQKDRRDETPGAKDSKP